MFQKSLKDAHDERIAHRAPILMTGDIFSLCRTGLPVEPGHTEALIGLHERIDHIVVALIVAGAAR